MSTAILIASGKGGVGKSTLAVGLARAFASSGKKVLVVDGDAGLSCLDIMLGVSESVVYNWYDVFWGDCEPESAIISVDENLYLMPAPRKRLAGAPTDCLKTVLDPVRDMYDYVLIDGPAGISDSLARCAVAADSCIVVATGDEVSVAGAHALDEAVSEKGITNTRLVINRYETKAVRKRKLLTVNGIIDKTTVRLLGIVPEDKEITYSTVTGRVYPKSSSSKAFRRIADRIDGKSVKLSISKLK